jgi:N-acetyltransferase 10
LAGARIVRIATHAKATKMGYGTRALEQLALFFEGKLASID